MKTKRTNAVCLRDDEKSDFIVFRFTFCNVFIAFVKFTTKNVHTFVCVKIENVLCLVDVTNQYFCALKMRANGLKFLSVQNRKNVTASIMNVLTMFIRSIRAKIVFFTRLENITR